MSLYPAPAIIEAQTWQRMPDELRQHGATSAWGQSNKVGAPVDSFLEGPSFDRDGNLWLVDIPFGRILTVSPQGDWTVRATYDGWPNGLRIHRDGRVFIADYKHGLMVLDPDTNEVTALLTHRYTESFRGCNDLVFADNGDLYFTDQGQSGLHQPDGRVFRLSVAGKLDCLISNAPSPNGLVLNQSQTILYVAMTRANAIWRLPFMADGGVSKVGNFIQLSGGLGGPDGMALDEQGSLAIAHAGAGCVWVFSRLGEPLYRVRSTAGATTTNVAYGGPTGNTLYITESETGTILEAELPTAGRTMFSHV